MLPKKAPKCAQRLRDAFVRLEKPEDTNQDIRRSETEFRAISRPICIGEPGSVWDHSHRFVEARASGCTFHEMTVSDGGSGTLEDAPQHRHSIVIGADLERANAFCILEGLRAAVVFAFPDVAFPIAAADGEIGHVEDFIVDDETWAIRYFEVDTRNWWPGKKVLVSPQWIDNVSWPDSKVYVDLKRETIQNGPEWNDSVPVTREYEDRLHNYYARSPYWAPKSEQPLSRTASKG